MLIIFSGLPGTGKTTIARELARQLGAVHVRIDSIEQVLRESGILVSEEGYRVGYVVTDDNLRIGRTVVADSVNPLPVTRDAWVDIAKLAGATALEVEVICSDWAEHRRRVETRSADVPGLRLPTWEEVVGRDYRPWHRERLVIDTARLSLDQGVAMIREALVDARSH
jgi:predicted kinase